MKKLSFLALSLFIVTWAISHFLRQDSEQSAQESVSNEDIYDGSLNSKKSLLTQKNKRSLDEIQAVINKDNVAISNDTKLAIKEKRKKYDAKKDLENLVTVLEQSYIDKNNTHKDIKKIQGKIKKLREELKNDILNTEKWDPNLVYYLMIQENYTYAEINLIKSLSENGINHEELEYIKEMVKEASFQERIKLFKNSDDAQRAIASYKVPTYREKDEYVDDGRPVTTIEDKLIEMNYSDEEIMEMQHGYNN